MRNGRHARRAGEGKFDTNALGNEVVLTAPNNSASLNNLSQRQPDKLLLNIDLEKISRSLALDFSPGSWIVTLSAEVLTTAPGVAIIVPVVARVQLGAGGKNEEFEVDAWKAVIPCNSPFVRISVAWDTLLPSYIAALSASVGIPLSVRITAVAQRSYANAELLTKTVRVIPNGPEIFRIPKLAKCFRFWNQDPFTDYTGGGWQSLETFPGGAITDQDTDLTRIQNFAKNLCCRPLHPYASDFSWFVDGAPRPSSIVFEIGL